jgi:hypothetical protein
MRDEKLLPCPCGMQLNAADEDCIYPATRPVYDPELDKMVFKVWELVCNPVYGGCDASVLGDSREDVIAVEQECVAVKYSEFV